MAGCRDERCGGDQNDVLLILSLAINIRGPQNYIYLNIQIYW